LEPRRGAGHGVAALRRRHARPIDAVLVRVAVRARLAARARLASAVDAYVPRVAVAVARASSAIDALAALAPLARPALEVAPALDALGTHPADADAPRSAVVVDDTRRPSIDARVLQRPVREPTSVRQIDRFGRVRAATSDGE